MNADFRQSSTLSILISTRKLFLLNSLGTTQYWAVCEKMRQSFTSKLLLLNLLVSPFRCLTLFNKIIIRLSRLKNNFLKNKCGIISDVFWKEKNEKLPGIIIIAVKYVGFLWSRVICTFFFLSTNRASHLWHYVMYDIFIFLQLLV